MESYGSNRVLSVRGRAFGSTHPFGPFWRGVSADLGLDARPRTYFANEHQHPSRLQARVLLIKLLNGKCT